MQGNNGLFSLVNGVPYIGHEKGEIKKISKEERAKLASKPNFKPNRLKDPSVFSPPITSFLPNMKKEFPRVFLK